MASAYSQDLRDRVIDAVVRGKMSRRAAAARFGERVLGHQVGAVRSGSVGSPTRMPIAGPGGQPALSSPSPSQNLRRKAEPCGSTKDQQLNQC